MAQKVQKKMKEKREKSTSLLEKTKTIWYDSRTIHRLFTFDGWYPRKSGPGPKRGKPWI
jgi:hypothetical protein